MKIGVYTDYSEDMVKFVQQAGFKSVELGAGPGSPLDATRLTQAKAEEIKAVLAEHDLEVSALGFYCNHLEPNLKQRQQMSEYFKKLIDACKLMEVDVVCTFAGRVPDKSIPDNIPVFKEVFTPLVRYAEDKGVKIAIENCPMMHGHPFRGINIAFTPEAWDLMFEAVDSEALGLEFDPSHLYWLMIDYLDAVKQYGEKIYHVHAKDTEIDYAKLAAAGIYGQGWWRYRMPGWGEVDWQKFVSALLDVGYQGNLDIEHEDPVFHGERFREGLVLGLKHLEQLVY